MKKKLTAIIAAGAMVLAIPASAFNITIIAPSSSAPSIISDHTRGGYAPAPFAPWDYGSCWPGCYDKTGDMMTGSYSFGGFWNHFPGALKFDVDDSGLIQNIQPSWGGNGAGTSTLNITPPTVTFGFAGAGGALTSATNSSQNGVPGAVSPPCWCGDGEFTTNALWPQDRASSTWLHPSQSPTGKDFFYVDFTISPETGTVSSASPAGSGTFSIDATGRAELNTAGSAVEVGLGYVMTDTSLVAEQGPIDGDLLRIKNELQASIDNIQLTPGPQGPQGKAGDQGTQGKIGADGAGGAAAPCVDCETLSVATFDLACALLAGNAPSTVSDFQSSVDAIATVATVGSGGNICDPIPGGFATCLEYINDQVQGIYDAKAAE